MTLATATLLVALLLFAAALFHALLALGAPWAAYAWGGQAEGDTLPPRLQLGSTLMAPFIAAMALIMLIRGSWLYPGAADQMAWPVWAVFFFLVTQMFGSLRSPSRQEKRIAGPLYAVAAALTAVVAFGAN